MRHNISRGARLLGAAAALALGVAACGGQSGQGGQGGQGDTIKLAYVGTKSGEVAQLGINILNGAKIAIEEYNAKGKGPKIELLEYDTQGDPNQATAVAPRVVKDGAVGVIGLPFSGESKNAVPIFEEAGIPNVSPSATAVSLAKNGWKTWHRVLANDDVQGPGVAEFITKNLGAKKVAVIDDQSEYGKGLADTVEKALKGAGVSVVNRQGVPAKTDDYSPVVNAVKAAGAEAVYYGGYYADAAKLLKQMRDGGVQAKFLSSDGSLDAQLSVQAGPAAEGALLSCTCNVSTESTDPQVKAFIDAYRKKFNTDPATYSAEGYDAATVFIKAIEAGKRTPQEINDFIKTVDFQGVSKHIKFSPTGELESKDVYIHEIKGGKIVSLGTVAEAKPSS